MPYQGAEVALLLEELAPATRIFRRRAIAEGPAR
jgi:hypothetical protein